MESVSLSDPVTIQVREYIDPAIGEDNSPSILAMMVGSRDEIIIIKLWSP